METLNQSELKEELIKTVEKITTTGKATLDETHLKTIKKICKKNESFLTDFHGKIMKQLSRNHCEIRLSAFQLIIEIFERSHKYRLLVLDDLQKILDLTLETDSKVLPPPKNAAKSLRKLSAETMHKWVQKYASAYRKLEHGYNYLKQVKRVVFNDIEGRSAIERQRQQEQKLKMDNIWRQRVAKVQLQIQETKVEMDECLVQLNNCIELLMPKPENFLFGQDELETNESDEDEQDLASHGILDPKVKISIDLDSNEDQEIIENEDNKEICNNLKDLNQLFAHKWYPMVKKWVVTLTKAGENCPPDLLKKSIDLKVELDQIHDKLKPFCKIIKTKNVKNSDSESDDDFIEVPEKSGYEATVKAEDHLLGIDFYSQPQPQPSTSKAALKADESKKVKKDLSIQKLTQNQKVHKVRVNSNQEHFWSSGLSRSDDDKTLEIEDPSTSFFEVEETFEQVKWSCRAPLPSGRLCPRMDRFKCPLHGPIIPRDNMGTPVKIEDKMSEEQKMKPNEDWQDPELLRDIEAATGINLQIKKKGKGKKSSSNSGLTNIKETQNTVRNRLEKKIFNRSSMKRVAQDLNLTEQKRRK